MSSQDLDVLAAVLIELGVGLAIAESMISSAQARSQGFQNLTQQSANTATLELATTAACVNEILGPRPLRAAQSSEEQFVQLNEPAPLAVS